jgi:hypothetical protein
MEIIVTLPDERYRALRCGHQMLLDLLNPKVTPRVPKYIRQRALNVLRHYPDSYHFTKIVEKLPEDFSINSRFCKRKCNGKFWAREWRKRYPDYYKKKSL